MFEPLREEIERVVAEGVQSGIAQGVLRATAGAADQQAAAAGDQQSTPPADPQDETLPKLAPRTRRRGKLPPVESPAAQVQKILHERNGELPLPPPPLAG